MENRRPTQHRMTRRAAAHDYTATGIYHITLHVADALGQPLGAVVGNPSAPDGTVTCDSFGDRRLLAAHLLPVVCHREDAARFAQQKTCCLDAAARGAVLVSARIAKGEQEIMNESVNHGFPVIIIADNGFPDRYHPSQERLDRSAAGRLLIVTPWQYRYRAAADTIHVPRCKAMNCVAQALCRTKDTWWKEK